MFSAPGSFVGRRAIIKGILSQPALNGEDVAVQSFDASSGRYVIEFRDGSSIKVKEENLQLVFDAPTVSAPTAARSRRSKPQAAAQAQASAQAHAAAQAQAAAQATAQAQAAAQAAMQTPSASPFDDALKCVLCSVGIYVDAVAPDPRSRGVQGFLCSNQITSLQALGDAMLKGGWDGVKSELMKPPWSLQEWNASYVYAQATQQPQPPGSGSSMGPSSWAQSGSQGSVRKAKLMSGRGAAQTTSPQQPLQPQPQSANSKRSGGAGPSRSVRTKAEIAADDGFSLMPLTESVDPATWRALNGLMRTKSAWLGRGRDASGTTYSTLHIACAWKIENARRTTKVNSGIDEVRADMEKVAKKVQLPGRRNGFIGEPVMTQADGLRQLHSDVNEVLLLHGTKPDVLLALLSNGLNEHFSGSNAGAAFGDGAYLAEDIGKADQYAELDCAYSPQSWDGLHERLYGNTNRHPGMVYYALVCRVALGIPLRTSTSGLSAISCDSPHGKVFPVTKRELATVPGVTPAVHYHSLIAEKGPGHDRYREFVIFRPSDYVCTEFLIAYQRK